MSILVVIFSCMDSFAFVVTVNRYDSISFCRLLTSRHTSKSRRKRLLEKLSTFSKLLHKFKLFSKYVIMVQWYVFPLSHHVLQPLDCGHSVEVMGTIARQLKALSQNTPRSSIIL